MQFRIEGAPVTFQVFGVQTSLFSSLSQKLFLSLRIVAFLCSGAIEDPDIHIACFCFG